MEESIIKDFLVIAGICYVVTFIISIIYRHYYPDKNIIIKEGCDLVKFKISLKRKGKYSTTFNTLKNDLKINVRGIYKHNSREITKCVLNKLIENKILEIDTQREIDIYREI